jgi:hypothetical protein
LDKALGSLERYFFLLSFCAYVNESHVHDFKEPFSRWIVARGEIWNMLEGLRQKGASLFLFRPVEDLSAFSKTGTTGIPNELENAVIRVSCRSSFSFQCDTFRIEMGQYWLRIPY